MSSTLQQLAVSGQELLTDSSVGIDEKTIDALVAWHAELERVLHHPANGQATREDLERILSVNESITALVKQGRDELGASIKQTRTGLDAVKAYQGKS